jgi:hypothetical protein
VTLPKLTVAGATWNEAGVEPCNCFGVALEAKPAHPFIMRRRGAKHKRAARAFLKFLWC